MVFCSIASICLSFLGMIYFSVYPKKLPYVVAVSLAINIVPFFFVGYLGMDSARVMGVPLAYIPFIFSGVIMIFRSWCIRKEDFFLFFVGLIFIFYVTINAFYRQFIFGTIPFYFSWIFNFLVFFSTISFFSSCDATVFQKSFKAIFYVLILGCFFGVMKFVFGINDDANFMPFTNRNGTVVFIVMLFPLVFYLKRYQLIPKKMFLISFFLIILVLILLQSRSGILGFVFVSLLYNFRLNFRNIFGGICILSVLFVALSFPVASAAKNRIFHSFETASSFSVDQKIKEGQSDYARFMLLRAAYTIFKAYPFLGAGIGVPNYRVAFDKHVNFFSRRSKAHCFYLSYLAELGVIGYSILLLFLFLIYSSLAPLNSGFRFARVTFLSLALMMSMNEYILVPELWFYLGMLVGGSRQLLHGKCLEVEEYASRKV